MTRYNKRLHKDAYFRQEHSKLGFAYTHPTKCILNDAKGFFSDSDLSLEIIYNHRFRFKLSVML